MQAARSVLLNHESQSSRISERPGTARLGRLAEIALGAIFG